MIEGNPWFVASDVAHLLYGRTTGLTDVFARLSMDEVRVVTRSEVICLPLFDGSKAPRIRLVSESGLYKLVMRSDKPEAKRFQDWVTKAVLPAIRKDGAYIRDEEKVVTGEMSEDELVLKAPSLDEWLLFEGAAMDSSKLLDPDPFKGKSRHPKFALGTGSDLIHP